ncbi:MAG: hypothetical protein ACM3ML_08905, partial [Micromonosporaceae bacterium]
LGRFLRRGAHLVWMAAAQPLVAGIHLPLDIGVLFQRVVDAAGAEGGLVGQAAGRNAPSQTVRPRAPLTFVNLRVFCFFLPDTNARRPGRPAFGRRTQISLPSARSLMPCAAA